MTEQVESSDGTVSTRSTPVTFSLVMTVFETWDFLPRAIGCVLQQQYPHWELILVVDGPSPAELPGPAAMLRQLRRCRFPQRIELLELPRAEGCWGNVGRRAGLDAARGEYVCWINHDNLIAPRYLSAHAENIARCDPCVSVVEIDLWQRHRYRGRFPRRLQRSRIDLLCYSIPTATAREVEAFGPHMERVYAADWEVFDACYRRLPVEWSHELVGMHF